MPNQSDPNQNKPPTSAIPTVADLPPLPPEFQKIGSEPSVATSPNTPGSAGPANEKVSVISPATVTPRKKFGGGRIIATILGILLLVGGVGAGIILTQQRQDVREKAEACDCGMADTGGCLPCTIGGEPVPSANVGITPGKDCECGIKEGGFGCKPCSGEEALPACGTNLTCKTSSVSGASTCKNSYGDTLWCCGSGQIINSSNTCQNSSSCPVGRSCGSSPVSGTTQCLSGGTTAFCCPAGENYDQFNGCSQAQTEYCSTNGECAFPKFCDSGTHKCIYASNTTCGRDTDPGAPVCCSPEVAQNCATASKVCEESSRLECIGSVGGSNVWCTIDANSSQCGGAGTSPPSTNPPDGTSAQCLNVKAYDADFTLLTATQLSALKPDDVVNFCVAGSKTAGEFDRAEFKVGNAAKVATTTLRPGSNDFCQSYTIQATDTTVSVKARIHHTPLGWVGETI